MKIAVYGKAFTLDARPYIEGLYRRLTDEGIDIALFDQLDTFLRDHCAWDREYPIFSDHKQLKKFDPDFLITIGGDGTILDAVTLVRNNRIPILGINTGRLGFLSNVAKEEIGPAINKLLAGNYVINPRYTLMVATSDDDEPEPNFALNEVTVSRKGTTSMITVHTYINDEYLNSYWADGLIVATTTGSTGYSLSCGGPIMMPGSKNFVITPIAPHNLTVRPFVIPSDFKIRLQVECRENEYLLSLDSRIYSYRNEVELFIQRSDVTILLVQTDLQTFPSTLRNKLVWGLDRRN
jgi:NAD+ kinase